MSKVVLRTLPLEYEGEDRDVTLRLARLFRTRPAADAGDNSALQRKDHA